MNWRISRLVLDWLVKKQQADKSVEICGLLVGKEGHIQDVLPLCNVADDPRTGFALDTRGHIAAVRNARARGLAILGHYHSHPSGDLVPSIDDASAADEQGKLWLILAGGRAALWRSRHGGPLAGAFEPMGLELVPDGPHRFSAGGSAIEMG